MSMHYDAERELPAVQTMDDLPVVLALQSRGLVRGPR